MRQSVVNAVNPTSTWRILLLIFRQTDTDYFDRAGTKRHLTAELPQADIDAMLASFSGPLTAAVSEWSGGQAAWDVEVQYPAEPVTRVSAPWGDYSQWLDPSSIAEALQRYYRPGYHDNVMVYWRSSDGAGNYIPDPGWGLALRNYGSNHYGYVTVTYLGWTPWNSQAADGASQVWIHEWLHTVCAFYSDLGYRVPVGDADGAESHGYVPDAWGYPGWGAYYVDIMNNRVLEDGVSTGIPSEAWARATIRASMDQVPPETSQTGADSAWHNTSVVMNLSATDYGAPASGVWRTQYKVDAGAWTTGTSVTVAAPADHSNDGSHTVSYRSTDVAGNTETSKTATVKIGTTTPADDTTPPTTTASGADNKWHNEDVTITVSAVDNGGGSGVAKTEIEVDSDGWVEDTIVTLIAQPNHSNDGVHIVRYRSTDAAGNVEAIKTVTVRIDTLGPATYAAATTRNTYRYRAVKLPYRITDARSSKATAIRIVVKNSAGRVVKTFYPTTRATATWYSVSWTPSVRGTYRYYVYAKDLAGNAQVKVGSMRVVVR